MPDTSTSDLLSLPSSLRVITLNCWGLKFLSTHRHARLTEIGHQLSIASPVPSIVALQECWTQEDYLAIRDLTKDILPYGKFYYSGVFGGGLAILSKWPIEESGMHRYPLNGRPSAFFRGDWFVGKGVASARIRIGPGTKDVLEVFCTHLHAPYERRTDSYLCHRTAQAWEIAKCMRHAAERGHMVLGLGDFNMLPLSLGHRLIEAHSPVRDLWRMVKPDSALGAAEQEAEKARGMGTPSAEECLREHGATCDSCFNTWRWSKQMQKDLLKRGKDSFVDPKGPDVRAKRLDYIFLADNAQETGYEWEVEDVQVGMTMRHPTLLCSLSDHFSVEATLKRVQRTSTSEQAVIRYLEPDRYDQVLAIIDKYTKRELSQRRRRLTEFGLSIAVSLGSFVGVWWSPYNYVAFILLFVSTLGFGGGVLEGLIGGLFVGSELRALREFEYEIRLAKEQAKSELQASEPSYLNL